MRDNTNNRRHDGILNDINRQLTKLTRQLDENKNRSFVLHDDPAEYIKVGPIKAVRLG